MDISSKYIRYKRYLEFEPDNSLLMSQVIELAVQANDLDGAWSFATQAMNSHSDDINCVYQAVNAALATSHEREAIYWLEPLLKECHTPYWAIYNYSYALFAQRQYQNLIDYIDSLEVLVIDDIPQIFMLQAKSLHHLGEYAQSKQVLEKYIQLFGLEAEAYGYLSLVLLDMGCLEDAKIAAIKALSLDKNQIYSLITMSAVCLNSADIDAANKYCDAGLEISQNVGRLLTLKGQLLSLQRRYSDAVEYFERSTQEMQHIGTLHGLAWCYLFLDQFTKCENAFKHALDLDPNFSESHGGMALAHVLKDDIDEANKYLSVALKLDRHCVTGRFTKVILLRKAGKDEEADEIIQAILNSPLVDRDQLLKEAVSELLSKVGK